MRKYIGPRDLQSRKPLVQAEARYSLKISRTSSPGQLLGRTKEDLPPVDPYPSPCSIQLGGDAGGVLGSSPGLLSGLPGATDGLPGCLLVLQVCQELVVEPLHLLEVVLQATPSWY